MKITFLGTGAADWYYEEHRSMKGYRRNSSLLIDDCLLIDPGPNVPNALEVFGKDAAGVKYIINTHSHRDHYNADTVEYLKLRGAELYPLEAGECKALGKYTVCAYRANHSTCEKAVHYIISDGEKRLFYGLDGAWLMYEEVQAIKEKTVDLAILDATAGENLGDFRVFEHNDLHMVVAIKAALEKNVNRWMISHMARILHTEHEILAEKMAKHGFEVAYDGFETEI